MTYEAFDVVAVPFPFTDAATEKRRPALVVSSRVYFNDASGHSVMAMITSAKNKSWPLDVPLNDLTLTGLTAPSVVRMKLFTLDHRFVIKKIGTLSAKDKRQVTKQLQALFGLLLD